MMKNIKIAIAEDNSFLLRSVTEKLALIGGNQIKFSAENGQVLLHKLKDYHQLDLILMDIQMPVMDGIQATEEVKKKYPHIKILMLTVFDDDENIFKAIQAGANGYLLKETNPEDLERSIKEILEGGASMTPSIAAKALSLLRQPPQFVNEKEENPLSKRENEVLTQLSKGLNYQEISDNLIISPSTVRKHIENIYRKLQVRNKMEAVQKADRNKWIS